MGVVHLSQGWYAEVTVSSLMLPPLLNDNLTVIMSFEQSFSNGKALTVGMFVTQLSSNVGISI
jgi:hypothetical protein